MPPRHHDKPQPVLSDRQYAGLKRYLAVRLTDLDRLAVLLCLEGRASSAKIAAALGVRVADVEAIMRRVRRGVRPTLRSAR